MEQRFETVTDWIAAAGVGLVLVVLYLGWFASYLTPKRAPVGSSLWFSLPAWTQLTAGLLITAVGAYVCYLLWQPLPIPNFSPPISILLRISGLLLVMVGTVLFLWARRTLGKMYAASTSSAVQLNVEHRLIQNGPYALVRHPIYVSYGLLFAGLLVTYRTWMPLLMLPMLIASMSRRARREEQVLAETFGDEWCAYAARVPRFVPRRW